MPADIDILVAGSSSIGYTPSYRFKNEIHDYDASSDILNSSIASSAFGSSSSTLDFPSLTSSSTSNSYLGTSPQIFSNSPPTHFTFHGRCSSPTLRTVPTASVSLSRNLSQLRLATSDGQQMPVAVPRRPCLVVRYDVLDLPSTTKNKKRVVFADDRGFPLALVSSGLVVQTSCSDTCLFPIKNQLFFSDSHNVGAFKRATSTPKRAAFYKIKPSSEFGKCGRTVGSDISTTRFGLLGFPSSFGHQQRVPGERHSQRERATRFGNR